MSGKISFVGAGPGAPDLITLRGAQALREADTVIYAGSLVNEKILELAQSAECHNSAKLSLPEVLAIMMRAYRDGKNVVRLHTGDPAMYGAVSEQYRELDAAAIPYTVVPGVSSVFAAAAALKVELTMPELSQSVILTRAAGRTPVPEREALAQLAQHGSTLCIFLSVGDLPELCRQLLEAGRVPETPVAIVYRASWENEIIVRGSIRDIADRAEAAGIKRQAMIIVGEVLSRQGELSKLYDAHFATGYRHHRFQGKVAIFALTRQAVLKGAEIAAGLTDATLFAPEKFSLEAPQLRSILFADGEFAGTLEEEWRNFDAFVFVMAAAIAVRHIGKLCRDKKSDPAAVVCDERGDYAVSLLSGHIGGGNDLARDIARVTGGKPVITTASDVAGIPAFDEFAKRHRAQIITPEHLTALIAAAVNGEAIALTMPRRLFDAEFAAHAHFTLAQERDDGICQACAHDRTLEMRLPYLCLGIGCRKGVSRERIAAVVAEVLRDIGLTMADISLLASATAKEQEPGLLEFAAAQHCEIRFYSAQELNQVPVPNPSAAARERIGVNSVSEAAALLGAGANAELLLEKYADQDVTVAIAERKR